MDSEMDTAPANENRQFFPLASAWLMVPRASSENEDVRSPGVLISPAPSPVFVDDDSRDSGYGGDHGGAACSKSSSNIGAHFLLPDGVGSFGQRSPPKKQRNTASCSLDVDMEEMLQFNEDSGQGCGSDDEITNTLLKGPILFTSINENSPAVDSPDYHMTPFKSGNYGRRTRFLRSESQGVTRLSAKRPNDGGFDNEQLGVPSQFSLKRRSSNVDRPFTQLRPPLKVVNRCYSETETKHVLEREVNPDLVGDNSMPHALPNTLHSKRPDLKSITCETVRNLIGGQYKDTVRSFTLIDCRYPYEYNGGHIQNAVNVYSQDDLVKLMFNQVTTDQLNYATDNRHIVIFYCEYSQERGPSMNRFLRKHDRKINGCQYPKLFYPEIYLLDGGYKNFFASCSDLCEPFGYKPMRHEDHKNELQHFRAKSKSWCCSDGDYTQTVNKRPGLNRELRF